MPRKSRGNKAEHSKPMLFTGLNYKLMGLGLLLVIIGFSAMRIENEVYGLVSLYISPIVILAGYAVVGFAILKRDHKLDNHSKTTA
jgi:hypothetical protein